MDQANEKLKVKCLFILTCIASTGALIYTKSVLIPFVMAFFLYSVTSPVIDWLEDKFKIHRMVCVAVTIVISFLVIGVISFLLIHSLEEFIKGAGIYKERLLELAHQSSELLAKYGFNVQVDSLKKAISNLPIFSVVKGITGGFFSFFSNLFVVLIFSIFMLAGEGVSRIHNPTLRDIHLKISGYVVSKLFLSVVTGLIIAFILAIAKIELVVLFCALTILLNFIPNVGSIIATALPLPVILMQYGFGVKFISVLLACLITQIIVGNIIEPKLMGDSMDLHPVTILVFLMFWGLVWGLPGMFMAVPITAILKITFSKIPTTNRIAELMAGRLK